MKIVVLNGSPRVNGNTAAMTKAFAEGAAEAGQRAGPQRREEQKGVGGE